MPSKMVVLSDVLCPCGSVSGFARNIWTKVKDTVA